MCTLIVGTGIPLAEFVSPPNTYPYKESTPYLVRVHHNDGLSDLASLRWPVDMGNCSVNGGHVCVLCYNAQLVMI